MWYTGQCSIKTHPAIECKAMFFSLLGSSKSVNRQPVSVSWLCLLDTIVRIGGLSFMLQSIERTWVCMHDRLKTIDTSIAANSACDDISVFLILNIHERTSTMPIIRLINVSHRQGTSQNPLQRPTHKKRKRNRHPPQYIRVMMEERNKDQAQPTQTRNRAWCWNKLKQPDPLRQRQELIWPSQQMTSLNRFSWVREVAYAQLITSATATLSEWVSEWVERIWGAVWHCV